MACAACGTSDHRYGTTDPHHDYDATACVNSLRGEVDRLRAEVLCLRADLAWCVGWIEIRRRHRADIGEGTTCGHRAPEIRAGDGHLPRLGLVDAERPPSVDAKMPPSPAPGGGEPGARMAANRRAARRS